MTVKKFVIEPAKLPTAALTVASLDIAPGTSGTGSLIPINALTFDELQQVMPDEADHARSEYLVLQQAKDVEIKDAELRAVQADH